MAVYIYAEVDDQSGEGVRADLIPCPTQDDAHVIIESYRQNADVRRAQVIIGTITEEYERG